MNTLCGKRLVTPGSLGTAYCPGRCPNRDRTRRIYDSRRSKAGRRLAGLEVENGRPRSMVHSPLSLLALELWRLCRAGTEPAGDGRPRFTWPLRPVGGNSPRQRHADDRRSQHCSGGFAPHSQSIEALLHASHGPLCSRSSGMKDLWSLTIRISRCAGRELNQMKTFRVAHFVRVPGWDFQGSIPSELHFRLTDGSHTLRGARRIARRKMRRPGIEPGL
jgi:hypothetical protein